MNSYRAKPLTFHWSPVIFILSNVLAVVVDCSSELPLPPLDAASLWTSGLILAILAVCLDIWAVKTLVEGQTTTMPFRCSKHLVTRGPFRFTRNPSYLAYTMFTASLALLTGNAWFLVAAFIAAVATNFVAIHQEEMHLLSRFGYDFESYCKRTRRWL